MKQKIAMFLVVALIFPFLVGARKKPMATEILFVEATNREGFYFSGTKTGLHNFLSNYPLMYVGGYLTPPGPAEYIHEFSFAMFDGINAGKPIKSAYLVMDHLADCTYGTFTDTIIFAIRASLLNDTPVPTTASQIQGYPYSSAIVWSIPPTEGCSGTYSTSQDISVLLNQVRELPGFTKNSLILLRVEFLSSNIPALSNGRVFATLTSGLPSELHITYYDPGTVRIYDEISPIDASALEDESFDSVTLFDTIVEKVNLSED